MPTEPAFNTTRDDFPSVPVVKAKLRGLIGCLDARASGWWDLVFHPLLAPGGELFLRAFVKAPDLSATVAEAFTRATRSVAVESDRLGIVRAAMTGLVEVSRAETLPAGYGSGYWLREFGAARSVAVPFPNSAGGVAAVVSVALADSPPDDDAVARAVREILDRSD